MAKKQKCPEFENHERWLVSYADMVTLLFAVFVVLYSLNISGDESEDKAAGSMQESFNTPLEDIPVDRRVGPGEQGLGIFDHFRGDQSRPPIKSAYPSQSSQSKIINDELSKINVMLEERLYGPNKFRDSKKKGEARIVDVQRTPNGLKLKLMARHFYKPGATTIRSEAKKDFDDVIQILKDIGRPVTIEGHTDSIPPSNTYNNWELSALRATTAVRYMIRKHNFPRTKLSAAGYADMRPIASNSTAEGRSLNRRIEIRVHYTDDDIDQ
ncbi:MAG: flagellar motor protein MotB [Bdellovibrionota bacterium]